MDASDGESLSSLARIGHSNNNNNNSSSDSGGSSTTPTIWEVYPYLRSHWALVQQARGKILHEASVILQSKGMGLESTCGSIRALVMLGGLTPSESISRLLGHRAIMVKGLLH
jgi:hypothetical protein